jgi:NTE family protein
LIYLTFSGGGTRAAAFSYGVLEELRKTEISIDGNNRRLLDEIDGISSVSGGSFTAGYYGLFGDRIFDDFEYGFLKKNVQRGVAVRVLFNPINWFRLASPTLIAAILQRNIMTSTFLKMGPSVTLLIEKVL